MKIVITGYNTCCLNKSGGVRVRVQKIYELLTKREDVEVEYFCPMTTDLMSCDVLHLFKLEAEYYNLVVKAKSEGKKVVLSSVVPLQDGAKLEIAKFLNKLPLLTIYKMQQQILEHVDCIIAETPKEADFICKHYFVDRRKIRVVPNGIDVEAYGGDSIYEKIGGKKDYILQVGLIHENKNQINTIKALKGTGIDVVFIGGENNGDMRYWDICKREAGQDSHFHFLGWVDSKSNLLKSAYANAKVFVFPSYKETFGLVALEAAMAGCNLAISKTLPIHDFHVFDKCWQFDPSDINDMREKILSAFSTSKSDELRNRVIRDFSWDNIIDTHIDIYKSVLQK